MPDITIIVRSTGHWSNIVIGRTIAVVSTVHGTADLTPDSAWELVSFCAARPELFTVVNDNETRSN